MTSNTDSPKNTRSRKQNKLQQFQEFLKRYLPVILSVISVLLLVLAGVMINLLITQTFKHEFTCDHLIDHTLYGEKGEPGQFQFYLCKTWGFDIQGFTLIEANALLGKYPKQDIGWNGLHFTFLEEGLSLIDGPLEEARKFVSWNIVIAFAVISVLLTFIAVKVKTFVQTLMEPQGRRKILENISIYLIIFTVISGLFYFVIVANN